jgi:hypothetical protein
VHVLKNNEPAYVIMAAEQYRELSEQYRKSYVARIRRSLEDLKEGRARRVTAQTLIDELGLKADVRAGHEQPLRPARGQIQASPP